MKALLVVDVQNDFLPGGSLAVTDGDQVIPVINRLMQQFSVVVATQDWHPVDHGSFADNHELSAGELIVLDGLQQILWPVHCVQESRGAEMASGLETDRFDATICKGTNPKIDSYSGFFDNGHRQATGLHDYLQSRGVDEVYVTGLATDYCVKFTALDAVQLGYKTNLILDACRGVNLSPGDCEAALEEMRQAGIQIMQSNQCYESEEQELG
ncbi:MAG: nicotinamidase/pyrazinamidase [Pirellulaceae bacterium]|jgi:nicotinamidase/pyrazinamidase